MTHFHSHSRRRALLMAAWALALPAGSVLAQTQAEPYPSKPVRLVLGFPAGGPTDVVARILGQRLGEVLGKPVVIDNRPGAAGNLAAEMVAKAPADGYTLLYNTSSITISPWVYTKVGFDPLKDFAPVGLTAEMPLVLLAHPSLRSANAQALVDRIKASPDTINYGSSGSGAIEHLTSAQFLSLNGASATHVPYKGTAPALIDFVAGQTQFMMTTLNTALPFVRDGRLQALAVSSKSRSATLPNVPTVTEAMGKPFASTAWQGVVAPAGTPATVIERLNKALGGILAEPAVRQKLAEQGVDALGGTPSQYAEFIKSELARWQGVVKQTGARAD